MGEESAAAWENMGGEAIMVPGITRGGGGDRGAPPINTEPAAPPSAPPSAPPAAAFSVLHSSLCSGSWKDTYATQQGQMQ